MRDTLHLSLMNISVWPWNGWKPSHEYETIFLSRFVKDFHNDSCAERTLTCCFLSGVFRESRDLCYNVPWLKLKPQYWPFPSLSHPSSAHSATPGKCMLPPSLVLASLNCFSSFLSLFIGLPSSWVVSFFQLSLNTRALQGQTQSGWFCLLFF